MTESTNLPLAPRDLMILAVLVESPLHGYGIIKAVETESESSVLLDPANLYRSLRRMRRDGWVEEIESEGDQRRRTFTLTASGRRVLSAEIRRLDRLLSRARPSLVAFLDG
jgi:DNA-binding PadR family transcriptional regulator